MNKTLKTLPQLGNQLFLTDGGLETSLIFLDGLELPYFAAFHLLRDQKGREALTRYYERYIAIAKADELGFILESPTWRANSDWGAKLGYSRAELAEANRQSVEMMHVLRSQHQTERSPMVVSGCVGPRGDGYDPGQVMSSEEAEAYHAEQIAAFAGTKADMVTAITMTNVNEAVGVVHAARNADLPVTISFTLETDGRLPTGQTLADAVQEVDRKTQSGPIYYMINCAHPSHYDTTMPIGAEWTKRVRGMRANASRRSHQELNDSPELDAGNPLELGGEYRDFRHNHPQITVLGGCCGTDHRHMESISLACRYAA